MRRLLRALLAATLLLLIVVNLARAGLVAQHGAWLAGGGAYVAISSLLWALAFAGCAYSLVSRQRWASGAILIAYLGYQLHLWLDRLAFVRASEAMQRAGWLLLLSALSSLVIGVLVRLAAGPTR